MKLAAMVQPYVTEEQGSFVAGNGSVPIEAWRSMFNTPASRDWTDLRRKWGQLDYVSTDRFFADDRGDCAILGFHYRMARW